MTTIAEIVGFLVMAAGAALVLLFVGWQIREWILYFVDVRKITADKRAFESALRKIAVGRGDAMWASTTAAEALKRKQYK